MYIYMEKSFRNSCGQIQWPVILDTSYFSDDRAQNQGPGGTMTLKSLLSQKLRGPVSDFFSQEKNPNGKEKCAFH